MGWGHFWRSNKEKRSCFGGILFMNSKIVDSGDLAGVQNKILHLYV